jgi:hypothetical protein
VLSIKQVGQQSHLPGYKTKLCQISNSAPSLIKLPLFLTAEWLHARKLFWFLVAVPTKLLKLQLDEKF